VQDDGHGYRHRSDHPALLRVLRSIAGNLDGRRTGSCPARRDGHGAAGDRRAKGLASWVAAGSRAGFAPGPPAVMKLRRHSQDENRIGSVPVKPVDGHGPGRGRPARVLILVENNAAAIDRRVFKQIDTLLRAGCRLHVISKREACNQIYRDEPKINLLEYPAPPERGSAWGYIFEYGYSFAAAVCLVLRVVLSEKIDVAQFCTPPDIYFPLSRLLRVLKVRIVVDQRDLLPELYVARYGAGRRVVPPALRWLEKRSQRGADHILCVNDYLRRRAFSNTGLPESRVTIVRNGPILSRVARARPSSALKQRRQYLCCWVGEIGRQDRVDLLVRSIYHLVHDLGRTDCQFAIIGYGECLEEARSLARELRLASWVTFTGQLPEEDVFNYLATADLGLDASLQFEVSPVKAMEYMAFGLPFVSFDLPETRAISDGAAGYATPGDVIGHARLIDELLRSPGRRAQLGQAGQARVREELGWELQARSYLQVIRDLCPVTAQIGQDDRTRPVASHRA
jgi:glycosyltransferase involved in cell wall biosynthesis